MLQATETEARSPGGPGRSDSVSPETVSVGHCEDGDCQGLAFVLLMARTARLARKEQEVESGQKSKGAEKQSRRRRFLPKTTRPEVASKLQALSHVP